MKNNMTVRMLSIIAAATVLAGCEVSRDGSGITDGGYDGGGAGGRYLADGVANIWVDPDGCQHWYIDDGIEGYMSPRLNRDGTPRCQDDRGEIVLKDGTTMMTEQEPVLPTT
ncbi:hypothetical protein DS901_14215 [Loktanella sp. D2R18]|uniref:hypothetical protein n=1 Tax=Rhodobacterales TaxID=204455 RepID=UPI000DEB6494|nr:MULTISPECIES: hypothetical protein [Rhodobacterales]MDO6588874.1 hypothetical protein [Yoonia sp. 1_MG-2023]RBW41901.1 hypothetical protein DS901_14215 [Loktanella sp. D2R18]